MASRFAAAIAVLFLLLSNAAVSRAQGRELRIAAAADLKFAMQDLAGQFEKQSSMKLAVTCGSSGNFFAQLQNGAPFDLFFSADIEYPKKLEAAGLTVPGSLYSYAVGRIVIWMPPDSKIDLAKQGWNALLDPRVQKIAIANPEHAPYGRAAVAALQKAGIYRQVQFKLVQGENISQAAQFVQSGNAQAGIVAFSLAVSPAMKDGQRWEIPSSLYPALEQGAVIMKDAQNKESAAEFLQFIKSDAARATLAKYGFTIPTPPAPVL
ncbi:MAG: molybdate ABC transporter substrate-binding protein [Candidatus Acidiferrum sp.]